MTGYDKATTFGILYDASDEEKYKQITLLVRDLQRDEKKVRTMGFVKQKKMPDYCFPKLTFEFCRKSSFKWNYQPRESNLKVFLSHKYDILLDFTGYDFFHLKMIVALADAKTKTGLYNKKLVELFDLMIQLDDTAPLEQISEQTIFYLKMIKNA